MAVIDELPEEILDVLAVELRTPAYDDSYNIEIKRELIRGTLVFYQRLGTPAAVNWVVQTIFGNGHIDEWFNYDGDPHHFRVYVRNDGTFRSLEGLADFLRIIAIVKRLSSWLDTIIVETDMGDSTLRMGGAMSAVVKLPIPELPDTYDFGSTIHGGGAISAQAILPLPELPDALYFRGSLHSGGAASVQTSQPIPQVADSLHFGSTLHGGGVGSTQITRPMPELADNKTMSTTDRIGVRGSVTITVPVPEISQ